MKLLFYNLSNIPKNLFLELMRVDHAEMDYSWTEEAWLEAMNKHYEVVLASASGFVYAFCLFKYSKHERLGHLLKVAVSDTYKRRGIAREMLVAYSQKRSCRLFLEVSSQNTPAIALYKSLGGLEINRIKKFYSDGSEALIMEINLSTS